MTIRTAVPTSTVDRLLGVNVDLTQGNWTSIDTMIAQAWYIGADMLRVAVPTASNWTVPYGCMDQLAAAGLKLDMVVDTGTTPAANVAAIAAFLIAHPGSVAFVEAPNEPNNWGVNYAGRTGVAGAQAWQQEFYAAMNANPVVASVPIIGMSSWPPVATASDANNLHIYPNNGNQPGTDIANGVAVQVAVDTGKAFVISEMGWFTAPGVSAPGTGWVGVDEATQAKLMLNAYMDAASLGALGLEFYELRDWIYTDAAAHFGLFHSDDTPKLAAVALHNLQTILTNPNAGTGAYTPGSLDTTITAPANVHSMLMQDSAGVFTLALWREPDIWDEANGRPITADTVTVNLHLNAAADIATYDPRVGDQALHTSLATTDIQLAVSDHPILLRITGPVVGSTASERPDLLSGTAGPDSMDGLGGNDTVNGLAGNDTMNGGSGADQMAGGAGNDVYVVDDLDDRVLEAVSQGTDEVRASVNAVLSDNVERLLLTGSAALDGTGNDLANTIVGNVGANRLQGGGGNDTLTGGDGNDTLDGGTGTDRLLGGLGNDTYMAKPGDILSEVSHGGIDTVVSAATIVLPARFEWLVLTGSAAVDGTGNPVNNRITGNTSANRLDGGAGHDTIDGGDGNDVLLGGSGNDILFGGTGQDVLTGGSGRDTMAGGAGADVFSYAAASEGGDLIQGFEPGVDVFSILASGFGGGLVAGMSVEAAGRFVTNLSGNATAAFGQFIYESDGNRLWWDVDGTGSVTHVLIATLQEHLAVAPSGIVLV